MNGSLSTPTRVLAIVGAAFVVGTVHALVGAPVSLKSATLSNPDAEVKGGERRTPNADTPADAPGPVVEDQLDETEEVVDPQQKIDDMLANLDDPEYRRNQLLDAPVPEGTMTLRRSHELWEQGAYFIDARHHDQYDAGHIEYALRLTSGEFDTDFEYANWVMEQIPQDGTVVIYCVGGDCDASKNVAARLEQFGYTDLRIMGAGYNEWEMAQLPKAFGPEGSEP